MRRIAPMLTAEGINGDVQAAATFLETCIGNGDYFEPTQRDEINRAIDVIEIAYSNAFIARYTERRQSVNEAIRQIREQPAWAAVLPHTAQGEPTAEEIALEEELLRPLTQRGGLDTALPERVAFAETLPGLAQLVSDTSAVERLRSDVGMRVQQLAAPEQRIERVRLSTIAGVGQTLGDETDVETLLNYVKEHLLNLIRAGIKVIVE